MVERGSESRDLPVASWSFNLVGHWLALMPASLKLFLKFPFGFLGFESLSGSFFKFCLLIGSKQKKPNGLSRSENQRKFEFEIKRELRRV